MSNDYFRFKRFCVCQGRSAMKVGTDGVLIGAWCGVGQNVKQILDIGCGSGLISLMLAQRTENEKSIIKAIDIDTESAVQAAENFEASEWAERLSAECVSLQDYSRRGEDKFELVVSNPPFFVDSLKAPDVARNNSRHCDTLTHEELLKYSSEMLENGGRLAAECVSLQDYSRRGEDKFELVVSNPPFFVDSLKAPDVARNNSRHCDTLTHEELLKYSSEMLENGGRLAVVLPSVEAKRMVDLSAVYGLVPSRLCIVKSTERKGEIRRLVEFVKTSEWIKCQIEQLCIHSDGDYSDDYKALTKDFYLKF